MDLRVVGQGHQVAGMAGCQPQRAHTLRGLAGRLGPQVELQAFHAGRAGGPGRRAALPARAARHPAGCADLTHLGHRQQQQLGAELHPQHLAGDRLRAAAEVQVHGLSIGRAAALPGGLAIVTAQPGAAGAAGWRAQQVESQAQRPQPNTGDAAAGGPAGDALQQHGGDAHLPFDAGGGPREPQQVAGVQAAAGGQAQIQLVTRPGLQRTAGAAQAGGQRHAVGPAPGRAGLQGQRSQGRRRGIDGAGQHQARHRQARGLRRTGQAQDPAALAAVGKEGAHRRRQVGLGIAAGGRVPGQRGIGTEHRRKLRCVLHRHRQAHRAAGGKPGQQGHVHARQGLGLLRGPQLEGKAGQAARGDGHGSRRAGCSGPAAAHSISSRS